MEDTLGQRAATPAPAPVAATAPPRHRVDPVGMWYVARAHHGIGDNIWFGFASRNDGGEEAFHWMTQPHREADGIGAMTQLLQARGYCGGLPPNGRDTQPPSLREIIAGWRRARANPAIATSAQIRWNYLDTARAQEAHVAAPSHVFLADSEYAQLRLGARAAGCSSTNWLMWTLDRALRQTLVDPDSRLRWVFPVNLRGAVQAPAPQMNHCGGLALVLNADTLPAEIAGQLRARFAAQEHWRSWLLLNLGRWVGQAGINLIYGYARERPGSWAGSYSNLGAWPLPGMAAPITGQGGTVSGAICTSPGSPAYPVSTGVVEWQGRLALACRVHPVANPDGLAGDRLLQAWRKLACGG